MVTRFGCNGPGGSHTSGHFFNRIAIGMDKMDKEHADTLKANLKAAKTEHEIAQAQTLALIAVVDCQFKTSERVKKLISDQERKKTQVDVVAWIVRGFMAIAGCGGLSLLALIARKVAAI